MNADIASGLPDNDSCSLFAALGVTEELFEAQGTTQASYDMHDVPDELNVCYEGTDIFSTRGHGIRRRHAVGAAQMRHLDQHCSGGRNQRPNFRNAAGRFGRLPQHVNRMDQAVVTTS